MQAVAELSPQSPALARIRVFSRPLTLLISIALVLSVLAPVACIVVILFFPTQLGSLHSFVGFNAWGVGLALDASPPLQNPGPGTVATLHTLAALIPLASLDLGQRLALAALAALCGTCEALALFNLRGLFVLFSRGIVFAGSNTARMKNFGLWLATSAIAANVAGRLYVHVTGAPVMGVANAALAVIAGAMIYVIAQVMKLGLEADLERRDFI